ncbi:MAG: carbohydrate binding family 9 domain-containing protein [Gemmatimonadota bacterium]|nr:MAG: carbohydrate binding family 9 domain-containing protein [Gemmatimonadota bacterium]
MGHISVPFFGRLSEKIFSTGGCALTVLVALWSCIAALLMKPAELAAQEGTAGVAPDSVILLARIAGPVDLDGRSDEPAWQGIEPFPLTMYTPTFRDPVTEATEIRVAYDDRYVYVSGRFYDSDPSGIQVNSMYRDRLSDDDCFGILIDPFNSNDIGLWFYTTPAGIRGDVSIGGDGQGAWNGSWDTFWDVATEQTSEGWFAELRIPFSSLGFQAAGGRVEMGISAYRYIPRKNERQVFPAIPPEFDYLRPSLAQDAILEGVQADKPVYLTPYVLSGVGQTSTLNDAGSGYYLDSDVESEIGGDLRYNVTSNLTLDLTVNTDFAQVEADDYQVNLTRFHLYYPEKRRFFQERSGIFDFFTGGSTRLFYSRQIGLYQGEAVRIIGGARLVGRVGDWDVGVLDLQTQRSTYLPSENFGVARARRRVFNDYSNAGAMLTTRLGDDGSYNVAYGLDGTFRVVGDDYLAIRWAQTFDDDVIAQNGFRFAEAAAVRVYVNRARERGFSYFLSARRFGADYHPEMGFITRQNFSDFYYSFAYFHWPEAGPFRRIDPFQLFGSVALRNPDGSVESAFIEHDVDFLWRAGSRLGLDLELYYEDLREDLLLPEDTYIPAGGYWFPRFEFDYSMPPGRQFRTFLGGGVQQFYDGWLADLWLVPVWYASPHLELSLQYSLDVVRFPDRDQGFDSHLVRLRIGTALNTKFSVNGFVQFSNVSDMAAANIRVRYNFREGNDLWIVYNEGYNLDRDRSDPALPITENRTILIKYTYTFAW